MLKTFTGPMDFFGRIFMLLLVPVDSFQDERFCRLNVEVYDLLQPLPCQLVGPCL